MAPVRFARAFRLPITAIMTALALSGCMRTTGPVAVAQPQSDLDSMAYGQTYAPVPVAVADSGGGGATSARLRSFSGLPPGSTSARSSAPGGSPHRGAVRIA